MIVVTNDKLFDGYMPAPAVVKKSKMLLYKKETVSSLNVLSIFKGG